MTGGYFDDGYHGNVAVYCPTCGRELLGGACGACLEHDRRRDDPLRLAEISFRTDVNPTTE